VAVVALGEAVEVTEAPEQSSVISPAVMRERSHVKNVRPEAL